MILGIVGTAGRGPDGEMLKVGYFTSMLKVSRYATTLLGAKCVVSGGAAYADHIAVVLFNSGHVSHLKLHLPAKWNGQKFAEGSDKFDPGRTSNWYHRQFSAARGVDSLAEIAEAINKGCEVTVGPGFKDRNTSIANDAETLLAFTFGNGPNLKDGGTKDTMDKFQLRKQVNPNLRAFHFDLNGKELHEI